MGIVLFGREAVAVASASLTGGPRVGSP
jgi:hypothetical protein